MMIIITRINATLYNYHSSVDAAAAAIPCCRWGNISDISFNHLRTQSSARPLNNSLIAYICYLAFNDFYICLTHSTRNQFVRAQIRHLDQLLLQQQQQRHRAR